MTTTNWTDRLSEYLDGTLTPAEQAACEAWLASDAEGRALLADLRRVVAKAKTMPDVAVPESVWSGISTAIRKSEAGVTSIAAAPSRTMTTSGRRWQFTPMQLAAAAAVVLAAGLTAGLLLRRPAGQDVAAGGRPRPPVTTGTPLISVGNRVGTRADVSYDRAVQQLQDIIDHNRTSLDTSTVRVLEQSLTKIDAALTEAQQALANDPHNAYLNDHLSRIKRKKLDLLRQGASLVQAS